MAFRTASILVRRSTRIYTTFRLKRSPKCHQPPGSLEEALDALEADNQFLLKGDVFTRDVVETHLSYKRSREIDEIRLRPHPYEFFLYYDV